MLKVLEIFMLKRFICLNLFILMFGFAGYAFPATVVVDDADYTSEADEDFDDEELDVSTQDVEKSDVDDEKEVKAAIDKKEKHKN